MIKGVIFDLDDTLYDAESCYNAGMERLSVFAQDKFDLSPEQFELAFNEAKRDVKRQLGNVATSHNRLLYIQRFLEEINESPVGFSLEMYEVYWGTVLNEMRLFPYVLPLFQTLKERDIRIALLSDLTVHIQHRKIKALGIGEFIDALVTSEEVGEEKPSKKMFEKVMKKLDLASEELLMVGDSLERDICGAEAVGIKGIPFIKQRGDAQGSRIIEEIIKCL